MAIGMFFGTAKRNDPQIARDLHPIKQIDPGYPDTMETGSFAHDGYLVLSKAVPGNEGNPPDVPGTIGRAHQGPDETFER
jgi:hypothetical protein